MSHSVFDASDESWKGPPDLNDITPWLLTYVRACYAEHQSELFDQTPSAAIEAVVRWTLCALVVNAVDEDDLPDFEEEDDDAEETGEETEGGSEGEGPNGRPS